MSEIFIAKTKDNNILFKNNSDKYTLIKPDNLDIDMVFELFFTFYYGNCCPKLITVNYDNIKIWEEKSIYEWFSPLWLSVRIKSSFPRDISRYNTSILNDLIQNGEKHYGQDIKHIHSLKYLKEWYNNFLIESIIK